jgi:hypothetical protein
VAVVSGAGRTDEAVRHGEVVTPVTVVATVRVDPNFRDTLILILFGVVVGVVAQVVAAGTGDQSSRQFRVTGRLRHYVMRSATDA